MWYGGMSRDVMCTICTGFGSMPSSSSLRGIPLIEGGAMSTGITGSGGTGIVASANPSTTGKIALT